MRRTLKPGVLSKRFSLVDAVADAGHSGDDPGLAEAFPQSVRSSGLAILYALGVMIFGGTTQFVVTWLIKETGDPLVPAWYQMAATVASSVLASFAANTPMTRVRFASEVQRTISRGSMGPAPEAQHG